MNVWPTWPTRSIPATSSSATNSFVCAPTFSPSVRAIPSRFLHRQASCWNGFLRFSIVSLPPPPPSSVCFHALRLFPQEARMARAAARSWLASKSPPFPPEFTMMQFRWSLMKISPSAPPLPLPLLSVPPKIPFGAKPVSASPRGGSELRHRSPGLLDFRSSLSPPKVITFAPQSHHFPPQT